MLATRARAILDGRYAASMEDVAGLAPAVLRHRMALTFAARADGVTVEQVIAGLVKRLG
jgi:MoxR-like ATPase